MVTIGQLAAYAGVTVRAVRHYHRRGLLAEPARDASGYRRYGAEHAIDLVKIKTLADAGVPLRRIGELMSASPEGFALAIAEIDRGLQERADEPLRIYLQYDAAFDRSPDDPSLVALADRAERWMADRSRGRRPVTNPAVARLVAISAGVSSPAWDRLAEIAAGPPPDVVC